MQELVFKPRSLAAGAEVFRRPGALAQADFGIQPGHEGQQACLAEFHARCGGKPAVVARGKLARKVHVALCVLFVPFPKRVGGQAQQYANPLVYYLPHRKAVLCHAKN